MYKLDKISKFYDLFPQGIKRDKLFYLEEAKKSKGKVLEIAIGTGRIFLELLSKGINIYGFDYSAAMLAELEKKALSKKLDLSQRISRQDMRSFKFKQKFDLIIIPYRSFLHNLTPADQLKTLRCCHKHLNPKGKLILNFFNFCPTIVAKKLADPNRQSMGEVVVDGLQVKAFEKSNYNFANQNISIKFMFETWIGKKLTQKFQERFQMSWIGRREFEYLAEKADFELKNLFGNFSRKPFKKEDDELIWVLEKK